ncbi:VWA domain-containing protein [Actinomadura sp. 6K520]|uniref:vWA domain-containing protein n=1 Tax=Actinomadura sp. 6K520 TaxID=2530364 RepID=UPI001FB7746D|nr:VWA domain-containing protein [Actinomadura sp. 6K520]
MERDVTETMVGFARTVRAAGGSADPERVQAMLAALDHLDVLDPADVYWAGRLTLCADPDDLARYDRCFAAYFSGATARPGRRPPPPVVVRRVTVPDPGAGDGAEESGNLKAATASAVEVLRDRDVARLSAAERAEVARLIAMLHAGAERRRSRRFTAASTGRLDPARTIRETLRRGGETALLRHRTHRTRPRRVVLIVDVSGSMSPYADALLRFAHAAARSGRDVEVFSAGTRLTRLTRELRHRDPDAAMAAASAAIPDWSGGTRLGAELKEFLDRFGQRGLARGAIVVIASDGWERGDAALLGEQMARLHRLAHRVVWANPHKARPGYEPLTAGMAAALPHVDDFTSGHSLAALEELARLVAGAGRGSGNLGKGRAHA